MGHTVYLAVGANLGDRRANIQHAIDRQAVDDLHHHEVKAVRFAHAEHGHNIGMVQLGGNSGFALKTRRAS